MIRPKVGTEVDSFKDILIILYPAEKKKARSNMDNFKIIYKILHILEASMDLEQFDKSSIGHERLGISEARWARIIAMMIKNGYVEGIEVWNSIDSDYPRVCLVRPEITLKGLEYLYENSLMKKMADMAKGIGQLIP